MRTSGGSSGTNKTRITTIAVACMKTLDELTEAERKSPITVAMLRSMVASIPHEYDAMPIQVYTLRSTTPEHMRLLVIKDTLVKLFDERFTYDGRNLKC